MRLSIHAVGRMKSGAARELIDIYCERCAKAGRQLGIRDFGVREFPESRAGTAVERKREESEKLLAGSHAGGFLIALDENGEDVSSSGFADLIRKSLDGGCPELAFAIGGPDGHGENLLQRADRTIRLGAMTWPHQLVRIMAAEQVYRAITILSGHPYHRD